MTYVCVCVCVRICACCVCTGRSIIGKKACITTPTSRGGNISLCAAISPFHGVVYYKVKLGAFNSTSLCDFFIDMYKSHAILRMYSHTFVMDNVSFHKTSELKDVVLNGCNNIAHQIKYLPTYSPQLNPIELCFSKVKSIVKQQEKTDRNSLVEMMNDACEQITQRDCEGWNREATRYLQDCLDRKPL